jgi:DNA repair exonuclease SbcCD ATPase subunit
MKNNVLLNEYLKQNMQQYDSIQTNVNESIVLSAIVCSACIGYALKGVLETDFGKSVGTGIGNLLSGIGAAFAGSKNNTAPQDKELSELRGLLKRKPEDLTPREKERITELNSKYNLEDELSENELAKLNKITNSTSDDDDTSTEVKPVKKFSKNELSGLLMLCKTEYDKLDAKNKNKEDEYMFDLLVACSHDKDGNLLEIDAMKEKMHDVVGEDNWEAFKNKIDTQYNKIKDSDEFIDALAKFEKDIKDGNIKKEDIDEFQKEAKEHAKSVMSKIEKAKAEQQNIKDEIAEIEQQMNNAGDDEDVSKLKTQVEKLREKMKSVTIPGVPADSADPSKGDKDVDDYTNKDIEAMQNELSELDPDKEEDKSKIEDLEKKLKAIAKAKGKNEDDFLPKTEMIGDGDDKKPVQKKVGPRGAKYFRTKGDNGWGDWRWYKNESDITVESNTLYNNLKNYLIESLETRETLN